MEQQVSFSLEMLVRMPKVMREIPNTYVWLACLDSWLVNVRLLTEFFLIHPARQDFDFSAQDFGWTKECVLEEVDLEPWWQIPSKYVVHFSRKRVPENLNDLLPENLQPERLEMVSHRYLQIMERFVLLMERNEVAEAVQFRASLTRIKSI